VIQETPHLALELKVLRKSFGKTEVIRGLDLSIHPGERIGIMGPNGAGKSTLFDVMSGRCIPSSGQIWLHGHRIDGKKPYKINRMGLSRSFQRSNIFPNLSVFENLRCAVLWSLGYRYTLFKFLAHLNDVNDRATELMHLVKLDHQRHVQALNLTHAAQRVLELGMTLACDARVILLDEPTSGMSRSETEHMISLIRSATQGKTLVTIEHDMGVIFDLADKIAVLVQGELLVFDTPDAICANAGVREAYLG
jgi:branched-chain amino acid transport system ATP-binding protein